MTALTLVDFLRARLDEDEAVARAATVSVLNGEPAEPWEWDHGPGSERDMSPAQDEHHRIWSPWRVLAECESKRRIVANMQTLSSQAWQDGDAAPVMEVCSTRVLRHLASVYADHQDYRDEWRP